MIKFWSNNEPRKDKNNLPMCYYCRQIGQVLQSNRLLKYTMSTIAIQIEIELEAELFCNLRKIMQIIWPTRPVVQIQAPNLGILSGDVRSLEDLHFLKTKTKKKKLFLSWVVIGIS